jgi:hypothetical protein
MIEEQQLEDLNGVLMKIPKIQCLLNFDKNIVNIPPNANPVPSFRPDIVRMIL